MYTQCDFVCLFRIVDPQGENANVQSTNYHRPNGKVLYCNTQNCYAHELFTNFVSGEVFIPWNNHNNNCEFFYSAHGVTTTLIANHIGCLPWKKINVIYSS